MTLRHLSRVVAVSAVLMAAASVPVLAQDDAPNAYASPQISPLGLLTTDSYGSRLYLHSNGAVRVLVEAAGCGNGVVLSRDGRSAGFKLIDG